MSITLYTYTNDINNVTKVTFDPTDNSSVIYNGQKYISFTKTNPLDDNEVSMGLQEFSIKSIENNTDYFLIVGGRNMLEMFFGSVTDVPSKLQFKLKDGSLHDPTLWAVRAIKKPPSQCETKNTDNTDKNTTTYKITMIVFIVLFSIMLIGSLILYFTGMMKFHFSSVSFGHSTHY